MDLVDSTNNSMEEKKLDINSIIGFVLIFGILLFWFYQNQPTPEEIEAQKAQTAQEEVEKAPEEEAIAKPILETQPIDLQDSTSVVNYKNAMGEFGFTTVSDGSTILENDVLFLEINNKGGQITEARLKDFVTYDSIPIYLVQDGNAVFDLNFTTANNRIINTKDLFFEPSMTQRGGNQILSLKAKVSSTQFLEYQYEMKPGEYLVGFTVRSQGLSGVFNQNQPIALNWKLRGIRHNKSIQYGNRYTRLTYNHEGDKISKLSESGDDEETEIDIKWLSYRQHFFSTILTTNTHFETVDITSKNLVTEESHTAKFTKEFSTVAPLALEGGELSYAMNWYYGPTDIEVLKEYKELGLVESIPYGWGIFGWINRYVFTPFYGFLSSFLPFGIAIIVMTIIVRVLMSPVTYKSYLSQAKMKVLKPEITELGEKYKDNAMKKQQETMKLYNKAGVSPMSGCIPAVLAITNILCLIYVLPYFFCIAPKVVLMGRRSVVL